MANDMKHGVSCSIYIPIAARARPAWYHASPEVAAEEIDALVAKLPGSTATLGVGTWEGLTEQVRIVNCVDSYGRVADTFRALVLALKDRGEQQVFITVAPVSFILE